MPKILLDKYRQEVNLFLNSYIFILLFINDCLDMLQSSGYLQYLLLLLGD